MKVVNESVEAAMTAGKIEVGYRKDGGPVTWLDTLEVTIPINRKIDKLKLTIGGNEVDV